MRLLIVEDDPDLNRQLAQALSAKQFAVDSAVDGREALYLGTENNYDLAIIDLGLPLLGGIDLIKALRKANRNYPILILTARGDWQDKVEGLEAGADDYVVKPFKIEEIFARINALLRRSAGNSQPVLQFGPLRIDTASKQVSLNQQPINLTSYEYNTLEYLVFRQGHTVSKAELTEHLYAQDYDRDSNVLEVFIGRLRKKLDPGGELQPITTVRGLGYRFALTQAP